MGVSPGGGISRPSNGLGLLSSEALADLAAFPYPPAKGTLIVGDGTAWVELAVGADGLVLTASSAASTGLAYAAAASASGWTDDGTVVRLTTVTDQVGIGTAAPVAARKLHVLATGTNIGVRSETALSTATALDVLVTADAVARWSLAASGTQSWSTGALAADVTLGRGAADRLDLGAGDSLLVPSGDIGATGATTALSEFLWNNTRNQLELGLPATPTGVDAGLLVVDGLVRFSTGLQGYGIGTGAVIGLARGTGAIDLQTERLVNTQVASGAYSTILGGRRNTASGARSIAGGEACLATFTSSIAIGDNASSAALDGIAIGNLASVTGTSGIAIGNNCVASVTHTLVMGLRAISVGQGERVYSSGMFVANGDCQRSDWSYRGTTTDAATATELFLDGVAAIYTIPINTTYAFDVRIAVRRTDGGAQEAASLVLNGALIRKLAAGSAAFVGAVVVPLVSFDAGLATITATLTTDGNRLYVLVTGVVAKTLLWQVVITGLKVTG